ncbi:MAG: FAD-dependent oxidoreductase [Clostridia bacterium]|nr:FAD-dependent oxidoreductase [Clostridia bacterium]
MKKYDVVIVGAGPAGMTAALNCLRAGKTAIVLESDTIGGQIALSPRVENFPTCQKSSGADLMDKLFEQITEWGADFELEKVEKIEKQDKYFYVKTDYSEYEAVSIILATGVKARHMGVAREEELVGKGVSYCALCDGAFYKDEDVVVIGDANTALQYALVLSGYCKSVQICTLFDRFFGDKALLDLVLNQPNVSYTHNLALKEFVGEDELTGLTFENTQDKSIVKYDCKCAFICIGQVPNNKAFENLVELDKNGFIVAGEDCKTSCEGIFVAGDCRTKHIRQLVTAAADGSISAFNACQYVDKIKSL